VGDSGAASSSSSGRRTVNSAPSPTGVYVEGRAHLVRQAGRLGLGVLPRLLGPLELGNHPCFARLDAAAHRPRDGRTEAGRAFGTWQRPDRQPKLARLPFQLDRHALADGAATEPGRLRERDPRLAPRSPRAKAKRLELRAPALLRGRSFAALTRISLRRTRRVSMVVVGLLEDVDGLRHGTLLGELHVETQRRHDVQRALRGVPKRLRALRVRAVWLGDPGRVQLQGERLLPVVHGAADERHGVSPGRPGIASVEVPAMGACVSEELEIGAGEGQRGGEGGRDDLRAGGLPVAEEAGEEGGSEEAAAGSGVVRAAIWVEAGSELPPAPGGGGGSVSRRRRTGRWNSWKWRGRGGGIWREC
jgi:hypothetical protein